MLSWQGPLSFDLDAADFESRTSSTVTQPVENLVPREQLLRRTLMSGDSSLQFGLLLGQESPSTSLDRGQLLQDAIASLLQRRVRAALKSASLRRGAPLQYLL